MDHQLGEEVVSRDGWNNDKFYNVVLNKFVRINATNYLYPALTARAQKRRPEVG